MLKLWRWLIAQKLIQLFLKFSTVGAFTTSLSILIYYILLDRLDFPLYSTYISVYLLMVLVSYLLNSLFTFKKEIRIKDSIYYQAVYGLGLLVGLGLLYVFQRLLPFSNFILTVLIIPPRVLLTFFLVNRLIFNTNDQSS